LFSIPGRAKVASSILSISCNHLFHIPLCKFTILMQLAVDARLAVQVDLADGEAKLQDMALWVYISEQVMLEGSEEVKATKGERGRD